MKSLQNPKWLIFTFLLPTAILFFISLGTFNIIQSILDENSLKHWRFFSILFIAIWLYNLTFIVYSIHKGKKLGLFYGLRSLLLNIAFVYLYYLKIEYIIPFSIPSWMVSFDFHLYVGTFFMPSIAHAIFILVLVFSEGKENKKAWVSFLISILIPTIFFLFSEGILPFFNFPNDEVYIHLGIVISVIGVVLFLFFLTRWIYILVVKNLSKWLKYKLVWKIPITILLPLLGLAINNDVIGNFSVGGFFGDFSSIWFYILVGLNGILICLPNLKKLHYRLVLFVGRSALFTICLYFFLVFLPYLPFSIFAIVAYGAGILMLVPLFIFFLNVKELSNDFNFLKDHFPKKLPLLVFSISILTLPIIITFNYMGDKKEIFKVLEYVYQPNYESKIDIKEKKLERALFHLNNNKKASRRFALSNNKPYLTPFYNWLVLDNLTISSDKIDLLDKIFLNGNVYRRADQVYFVNNDSVVITNVLVHSNYDSIDKYWTSEVELEITNNYHNQSEFVSSFDLPNGVFITNYHLWVNDKKEPGILAEKKTAKWIYQNIVTIERRDPGILFYDGGNHICFRVFPFDPNQTRKTSIEFVHKEPVSFCLNNKTINIGNDSIQKINDQKPIYSNDSSLVYLSSNYKSSLPKVKMKPYLHFVIDCSKNTDSIKGDVIAKMDKYFLNKTISDKDKISFVNYASKTMNLKDNWKSELETFDCQGGFYLDYFFKAQLMNSYITDENYYPIFIILSNDLENASFRGGLPDFELLSKGNDQFLYLDSSLNYEFYNLFSNDLTETIDSIRHSKDKICYQWKSSNNQMYFLPMDSKSNYIYQFQNHKDSNATDQQDKWLTALNLQANYYTYIFKGQELDDEWLRIVKSSFKDQIMTPLTSFIVVENEAQKAMLIKKQQKILKSSHILDLGEDHMTMSEPAWYFYLLLTIPLFLIVRKKYKWTT